MLNPELTASWEKGLTYVAEGSITADEYMQKLSGFVGRRTLAVKDLRNQAQLVTLFNETAKIINKEESYERTDYNQRVV